MKKAGDLEALLATADYKTLVDIYEGIMKPRDLPNEGMWQLRQWDGMDGTWTDCGPARTPHEALKEWFRRTKGGEKNTSFNDIDYYRLFPATTVMAWSEGREMFRGDETPLPEPDPLVLLDTGKKRRPPWRFELAQQLLGVMEKFLEPAGWHCGMTGSILHKGESTHDLDVILCPRDSTKAEKDAARKVLLTFGMTPMHTVEEVHAGWRKKGGTDEKHVEVWRWHYYRIDFFFLR